LRQNTESLKHFLKGSRSRGRAEEEYEQQKASAKKINRQPNRLILCRYQNGCSGQIQQIINDMLSLIICSVKRFVQKRLEHFSIKPIKGVNQFGSLRDGANSDRRQGDVS
jgi:hypothetical protein